MLYLRFVARWLFKLLMWAGIVSMAWMVFSCEEFCEDPDRTAVVVYFYDANDLLADVRNLEIKGIGNNDSILYPNDETFGKDKRNFSQVLLPLNPVADFMSFTIKNDTFPVDTVIIRYSRHVGFISSQCGCATFAEIQDDTESTHHTVRRMEVVNPNVITVSYRQGVVNAENISIYY